MMLRHRAMHLAVAGVMRLWPVMPRRWRLWVFMHDCFAGECPLEG